MAQVRRDPESNRGEKSKWDMRCTGQIGEGSRGADDDPGTAANRQGNTGLAIEELLCG